jgi:hypothetical protein
VNLAVIPGDDVLHPPRQIPCRDTLFPRLRTHLSRYFCLLISISLSGKKTTVTKQIPGKNVQLVFVTLAGAIEDTVHPTRASPFLLNGDIEKTDAPDTT